MATIVVHGTTPIRIATSGSWWRTSWHQDGALGALKRGMSDAGFDHDIWRVAGVNVDKIPELSPDRRVFFSDEGRFFWSGINQQQFRQNAGDKLARYLNLIAALSPNEPIRVIAHSHGANVVKACTQSEELDSSVVLSMVCFLGCPHFTSSGSSKPFPYRLDSRRVGAVVNLYSISDSVQDGFADLLPNLFGGGFDNWAREAHREDQDPACSQVYENHALNTASEGIAAHNDLHGATVLYLIGQWLSKRGSFQKILEQNLHLFPIPEGDNGD